MLELKVQYRILNFKITVEFGLELNDDAAKAGAYRDLLDSAIQSNDAGDSEQMLPISLVGMRLTPLDFIRVTPNTTWPQ